jgi:hypothetical protein
MEIGSVDELIQQRCFNHMRREAAAKCPECGRFFCRECVTEHSDRVLCAACLKRIFPHEERHPGRGKIFRHGMLTILSFFLLWFLFYGLGRLLLLLPSTFHEGTIWPQTSGGGG